MVKKFWDWLKRFFFPPAGSPTWVKILPYVVLGVLTLMVLTAGAYTWEYTNSPQFCGATCHTMPPEYTAYLTSPHARIDCVDCHIGKGFIATRITRKAGDIKHVIATVFHTYEFPIRAGELRPARETCEKCHFPEKFSDDSLREIMRYVNDKENTPQSIYLILKTGGGSKRLGLGKGIHWHIENPIYYLAIDEEEQQIPYLRVVGEDGKFIEYIDVESDIDPDQVDRKNLEEMDCMTCHNRITHLVPTPEDTVDELISRGLISRSIPEIRLKAIEVYSQIFSTTQQGLNNIAGLTNYYSTYYPEYYNGNKGEVDKAITFLQEAYQASVFPEQRSDWSSHPNNVGHKDAPGCFRCHDGKHLDQDNQAVRLECNLCHSIPIIAGPFDFIAEVEISRGPEPESHLNPNWINLHYQVFDVTCENCHTTDNPGGSDNSSFCSNSACHGSSWDYAGFDAPALREILVDQLPPTPEPFTLLADAKLTFIDTIEPLFKARCVSCHGEKGVQGLNLSTYSSTMAGSNNGLVIVPDNPESSLLIQKQSGSEAHFGQLTKEELQLVIEWILLGCPEI